jgi:hypothetical protein
MVGAQGARGCGGRQRLLPAVDAAYGTPRNPHDVPKSSPWTLPPGNVTKHEPWSESPSIDPVAGTMNEPATSTAIAIADRVVATGPNGRVIAFPFAA